MRGIGVAVMTSKSTAVPLRGERQALVDAEAVLLVDDGEREIRERHVVGKQRMGADENIDIALDEPFEQVGAFAAALAAGEDREPQASGGGERRDGFEMLAGKNFGRGHQGGLGVAAAGRNRRRTGKQRHHGLAGADIALNSAAACVPAGRGRGRYPRSLPPGWQ